MPFIIGEDMLNFLFLIIQNDRKLTLLPVQEFAEYNGLVY
jgi:hypothetical protein